MKNMKGNEVKSRANYVDKRSRMHEKAQKRRFAAVAFGSVASQSFHLFLYNIFLLFHVIFL